MGAMRTNGAPAAAPMDTPRMSAPAAVSLDVAPATPLPTTLSAFIGRDVEIVEACEALRATRLLTLAGAGGIGKTRLAVQVAARSGVRGVRHELTCFVDLAPASTPDGVWRAVATAAGIEIAGDTALAAVLLAGLAERDVLLLLLDNCEHVVAACAELVNALLQGTSRVR